MSIGRIIAGKYCLLHELGRGAMGSVWAAEHLTLRSHVAVKLIELKALRTPHVPHRFEREARALATLRSPHVVQVLDYGVDSGTQYLVMELLDGETLRHRLTLSERLEPTELCAVVQQVARALDVTHVAGFVHRDLKPENIFLIHNGDELLVKVLDFGITKALAPEATHLTEAGVMLGTCHYMSPEQAKGDPIDQRSDLWSLGVIVFECLLGFLPFRGDSVFASVSAICDNPIVVPSQVARVPAGFDAWFARAACRDRARRFQTATELVDELEIVLAARDWVGENVAPLLPATEDDTLRIDAFPSSAGDRRGGVRIPSSIPVALDGRRDLHNTALIYNASRSGALLSTRRSCQPNQSVLLTLHLDSPEHGESVRAQVVRVSPRNDPFWRFEIGVRFTEPLTDDLLARVETKARNREL